MLQLILTEEQAKVLQNTDSNGPIQLCDPTGKVLLFFDPQLTKDYIAELKQRARSPGPRYTGAQVQARLQALQEEWDRVGQFDEKYMFEFLARLDKEDPGHWRPRSEGQ